MLKRYRAWRDARTLERHPIPDELWRTTVDALHILDRLDDAEIERLRELATLFLRQKEFVGTHELVVTDAMCVTVAAQACLPILNLGLDYYRGWRTLILYPTAFVAHRERRDEDGVVHTGYEELDGESAEGGPVVLSWDEAQPQAADEPYNVVVHEFAHKLDELTGAPNGLPPLHKEMSIEAWSRAMTTAYDAFNDLLDRDVEPPFDDYAGSDPAEFFAVTSELFFAAPDVVIDTYPDVYAQLKLFYRQDPIAAYEPLPDPR
jgi:Mlc titration factor MtfA (ptsG expression regulator)